MSKKPYGSQRTISKNGKTEYMKDYMYNWRKRQKSIKKQRQQRVLELYDWTMDAYIIPREEAKQLTIL